MSGMHSDNYELARSLALKVSKITVPLLINNGIIKPIQMVQSIKHKTPMWNSTSPQSIKVMLILMCLICILLFQLVWLHVYLLELLLLLSLLLVITYAL